MNKIALRVARQFSSNLLFKSSTFGLYQPTHLKEEDRLERVLPEGYSVRRYKNRPVLFAIVPQGENWISERLGKFHRSMQPGFHLLIPFIDRVAFKHSMKEVTFVIHKQSAITKDNVYINIDGICYLRIQDPVKASYEVERIFFAITSLAQTTMRSEIGKIRLDQTFEERHNLNLHIVAAISHVAKQWGVQVERYEIRDISVPENIKNAMELEAEAERRKRQRVLESEAKRTYSVNVAQGEKDAAILTSEGKAFQIERIAKAQRDAIKIVAEGINTIGGLDAVSYELAKQFTEAYGKLASTSTVIIPQGNINPIPELVTTSLATFNAIKNKKIEKIKTPEQILEEEAKKEEEQAKASVEVINKIEPNKQKKL